MTGPTNDHPKHPKQIQQDDNSLSVEYLPKAEIELKDWGESYSAHDRLRKFVTPRLALSPGDTIDNAWESGWYEAFPYGGVQTVSLEDAYQSLTVAGKGLAHVHQGLRGLATVLANKQDEWVTLTPENGYGFFIDSNGDEYLNGVVSELKRNYSSMMFAENIGYRTSSSYLDEVKGKDSAAEFLVLVARLDDAARSIRVDTQSAYGWCVDQLEQGIIMLKTAEPRAMAVWGRIQAPAVREHIEKAGPKFRDDFGW